MRLAQVHHSRCQLIHRQLSHQRRLRTWVPCFPVLWQHRAVTAALAPLRMTASPQLLTHCRVLSVHGLTQNTTIFNSHLCQSLHHSTAQIMTRPPCNTQQRHILLQQVTVLISSAAGMILQSCRLLTHRSQLLALNHMLHSRHLIIMISH